MWAGEPSANGTAFYSIPKPATAIFPLNHLGQDQAAYAVYNSLLAEAGVLGFEYGYAITQPDRLVLWEAQFGDFANGAQTIIDLFIAAGETKWERLCGLVMLLPHGWEGLGPEHSSARLERFLQLCAENNLQVCNLTTPAQYFHLLRRQMHAPFRKPLVLMTPKSLLRHPMAVSDLNAMATGRFQAVLDDPDKPVSASRVVVCSGKLYYQLLNEKHAKKNNDTAIIRLEQFYPFPEEVLASLVKTYKQGRYMDLGTGRTAKHGRVAVCEAPPRSCYRGAAAVRGAQGLCQPGHRFSGHLPGPAGSDIQRLVWI